MGETGSRSISDTLHQDKFRMGEGVKYKEGNYKWTRWAQNSIFVRYLSDLWEGEDFKTKQELEKIIKSKINHFDYIKLKRFCTNKNNVTKIRRETTIWGKYS